MENPSVKINTKELLSPNIIKNPSRFLEILEYIDSIVPSREMALDVKKAMAVQKDPVLSFLLKKSFRLAAFKLKGAAFKISLSGLEKLLQSPDRLDDLALAVTSVNSAEAFMASDFFKTANWKNYPTEILPCFCYFYKKHGNSQDLDDLLELTRNPNPTVIAAAVEALKKLDTGSLRSIIAPLIQNTTDQKDTEAIEQLYATNANYNSSNISNESKEYYIENHQLIVDSLVNGTSELETTRILRLIKKYGDASDAEYVKPYLTKDNPNIVRAAVKVLEKLDTEYLCIYLPQLLQDKNTKIRLTATRAFQSIDKDSVNRMVLNLLKSLNVKQRTLGVTTAMLVDFEIVKQALLDAFSRENNDELLEKIGLVLAANPYKELVKDVYFAHKYSKTLLVAPREKILELISEKVSTFLGGKPSGKELLSEAKKFFDDYCKQNIQNVNAALQQNKPSNGASSNSSRPASGRNAPPGDMEDRINSTRELISNKIASNIQKAKKVEKKPIIISIIWIGVMLVWGILLVVLLMKLF